MPPQSDCRYMAMRTISTFPAISPAPIPRHFNQPRRFSWKNRAGAGIEPASPNMPGRRDTAREIESLASPGCTSPSSRRLRSGAFPALPADPIASRGGLNPRPLSTSINIHDRRIYGKGQSYIGSHLHDIGTNRHISRGCGNGRREKGATRRASRPTDRHAILLAVPRID